MGLQNGGQAFNPVALDRLRRARELAGERLLLEVDGGINPETISSCAAAGGQLFVVGSAIFKQPDYGAAIRRLALVSFVYSGLQLCFIAFMTVHLTTKAGFSLVQAGQALAIYQVGGAVSRPIWGIIADRWLAARWLLALQGIIASGAAVLAGRFDAGWPHALILLVCAVGGATASGFTGIAYGEWARIGGDKRTEATGLGASAMFSGVLVLPSLMSVIVTVRGGYEGAYLLMGGLALVAGLLVALGRGR